MPSLKSHRMLPLFLFFIPCLLFQMYAGVLTRNAAAQPFGEIGAAKTNEAAVEKLRKMSPEEIEKLDAFLAKALMLYYDRKFAQALPIFKELADKVETMDIMFWIGTSAAKVGEVDLAIEKFQKMLSIDPELHRVRLELAAVYFATGRLQEANRELQTVRAADLPPEVRANVEKMQAAIDDRARKLFWNFRLSTGHMWDDNITSGPDEGIYSLPGGSSFQPARTSAKLSDQAFVTSFSGNLLYDIGERQGLMWNTAAAGYLKFYRDYSQFDYKVLDVNTGPWWVTQQSIFKIPVGYTHTEYGSDHLSYIHHVDPSFEYFFNKHFSLRESYTYRREHFYQKWRSDLFNSTTQILELAPTFYLDNRRHIITFSLGYEYHDAANNAYSYNAPIAGVSYFTRFPTQTELYLGYQWTLRDYVGTQRFPYTGLEREDKRHYYTGALSQTIFKYFNLSYAFTYTDNNSDLALNEWEKITHTISVGCQF